MTDAISRRLFLGALGAGASAPLFAGIASPSVASVGALRRDILASPVGVASHRAKVFTRVFQEHEGEPWLSSKALALREYFRTVPLYVRPEDRIAGSISETPGAMPVMVELGIAENNIYIGENTRQRGLPAQPGSGRDSRLLEEPQSVGPRAYRDFRTEALRFGR